MIAKNRTIKKKTKITLDNIFQNTQNQILDVNMTAAVARKRICFVSNFKYHIELCEC